MVQINQVGTVGTDKAAIGLQLSTQLVHASRTLQNLSACQVKENCPMDYLAVFKIPQLYSGNAGFALRFQLVIA